MRIQQLIWNNNGDFKTFRSSDGFCRADLVLIFGSRELVGTDRLIDSIHSIYPTAHMIGCTTSGEILGAQVFDNSLTTTAIQFDKTTIKIASIEIKSAESSFEVGAELAKTLDEAGLAHVFMLSEGLNVNGSQLLAGMKTALPNCVSITGGLAGDGILFSQTKTIADGYAKQNIISAIGLYGDSIRVGFGSVGGWDSFGIERLITKSKNNILYEMDGKPVLELYYNYLGDYAKDLPASGLLFPLSIRSKDSKEGLVRTILGINKQEQSMTFAGDVPEGYYAKLMKANIDSLVDGAHDAAELSIHNLDATPELAILISCIGRKLVFNQRVEEEVEIVRDRMGETCMLTGFYSYGEICPHTQIICSNGTNSYNYKLGCELHNQTMTITTLLED